MPTDSIEIVFEKLAWLRLTAIRMLAGEVSYTGWGVAQTRQHAQEYLDLRETLRVIQPNVFGDIEEFRYAIAIGNQKTALKNMRNEIERLFLIGAAAGLCQPLAPIDILAQSSLPTKSGFDWRAHLGKILVGLLVAYLVYRFGWNK